MVGKGINCIFVEYKEMYNKYGGFSTLDKEVYSKKWFAILMLFILAPIGIFLIYKFKHFGNVANAVLSVVFGLVFIFALTSGGGEDTPKEKKEPAAVATTANTEVDKKDDEKAKAEAEKKKAEEAKKAEEEAAKKAEEEAAKKAAEEAKKTPQEKMIEKVTGLMSSKQAFDAGSYIKGDIPEGEYAFISFTEDGKYYSEKDPAGNIIDNENFDSFGYVYVHDSGNLETRGVLISTSAFSTLGVSSAKEIYEILNNVQDYKDAGWYKVGVDIQPGKYVIESYGEGYVAIMGGPVGKNDIIDNEIFNGRYSVNVTNGQYLKISRGKITQ